MNWESLIKHPTQIFTPNGNRANWWCWLSENTHPTEQGNCKPPYSLPADWLQPAEGENHRCIQYLQTICDRDLEKSLFMSGPWGISDPSVTVQKTQRPKLKLTATDFKLLPVSVATITTADVLRSRWKQLVIFRVVLKNIQGSPLQEELWRMNAVNKMLHIVRIHIQTVIF